MPSLLRQILLSALVVVTCALATPAAAQKIVAMVNGEPITSYDIAQRQRMSELIERKAINSKQALDDLIDERIMTQQASRVRADVDEKDIERMYANVAKNSGRTPAELTAGFAQAGLDARTFKDRLVAKFVWNQYVHSRSGAVTIRDSDITAALLKRGETQLVATEYELRPIIFVVPRKAGNPGARMKEAEALRARFTDCATGLEMAKGLREVVVRQQARRLSSEMPPPLRKILDATPVGHLTPPEVSQSGVETFAVCAKNTVRGESAEKRQIKDELSNSQFEVESKKLLDELRKSSLIEYR